MIEMKNDVIIKSPRLEELLSILSEPSERVKIKSSKSTGVIQVINRLFTDIEIDYSCTPEYWLPLYYALDRVGNCNFKESDGSVDIDELMHEFKPDEDLGMDIMYNLNLYDYSIGTSPGPARSVHHYYYLSREYEYTEQVDLIIFEQKPYMMWKGWFKVIPSDIHDLLINYMNSMI